MASKRQRDPADGKRLREVSSGKQLRNADDNKCCCTGPGGTDLYPLNYCPSGVFSGKCIALTPTDAATYVGKVVRSADAADGFTCYTVGNKEDIVEDDCLAFPAVSAPMDDCETCCVFCTDVPVPETAFTVTIEYTLPGDPTPRSIDITVNGSCAGLSWNGSDTVVGPDPPYQNHTFDAFVERTGTCNDTCGWEVQFTIQATNSDSTAAFTCDWCINKPGLHPAGEYPIGNLTLTGSVNPPCPTITSVTVA